MYHLNGLYVLDTSESFTKLPSSWHYNTERFVKILWLWYEVGKRGSLNIEEHNITIICYGCKEKL